MYTNPRRLYYPAPNDSGICPAQAPILNLPLYTSVTQPVPPFTSEVSLVPLPSPSYSAYTYQPSNVEPIRPTTYAMYDMARALRLVWTDPTEDITLRIEIKNQYGQREGGDFIVAADSVLETSFWASQILSITPIALSGTPAPTSIVSVGLGMLGQTRFWQFDVCKPYWGATVEVYLPTVPTEWTYSIYSTNSQISWPSTAFPGTIECQNGFYEYAQASNLAASSYTVIPAPVTNLWIQPTITDPEDTPDITFTAIILQQGV